MQENAGEKMKGYDKSASGREDGRGRRREEREGEREAEI